MSDAERILSNQAIIMRALALLIANAATPASKDDCLDVMTMLVKAYQRTRDDLLYRNN